MSLEVSDCLVVVVASILLQITNVDKVQAGKA
jgi:hypothetical protein